MSGLLRIVDYLHILSTSLAEMGRYWREVTVWYQLKAHLVVDVNP